MVEPAPGLAGVLETALYYDAGQREAMEAFYGEVLGMPAVSRWGDGTAVRIGSGVLLLFDRAQLAERDEPMADHGAAGPGHACLQSAPGEYDAWKERVRSSEVEITHEHAWSEGRRSFYFKDPAGNLLEVAEGNIWPAA